MLRWSSIVFMAGSWIAPSNAQVASQAPEWDTARPFEIRHRPDGSMYVADEVLVGLKSGDDRARVLNVLSARGGELIGELGALNVLRVRIASSLDPLQVAESFASIEGVLYAEANDIGQGGALGGPDDTHFARQWHHDNTGQAGGLVGADLESIATWAAAVQPHPVLLAVLDTGIDMSHPEFAGRVVTGWDYVNEDSDATADHPHGILCAGLAAANSDNGFGVAGVDRTCTLYPIKVLNGSNLGTVTDLVQGLNHCATNGIEVVSMSLINFGSSATLENGLIAARNAGCILMACAGNGGLGDANVSGPGQSTQTISIGATTNLDQRASFSGTGSKLDFVAPGSNVITVAIAHTDTWSSFSGCSAATPVAAGVVATLVGQDPNLTQAQVYALLKSGAEDQVGAVLEDTPGRDDFMGWGRLNSKRSLSALKGCDVPTPYCTSSTTTGGCRPTMSAAGTASATTTSGFSLVCSQVDAQRTGLIFFGLAPDADAWAFGNSSTRCVATPVQRTPKSNSGGTSGTCEGVLSVDWNAWRTLNPTGLGSPYGTGQVLYAQTWFRDPAAVTGTNLSDGVSFTLCN